MNRPWFFLVAALLPLSAGVALGVPGYGDPLTFTTGAIYRVGTAAALINAVDTINSAGVPATILLSNGVYVLDTWALPMTCDHVIVRSLNGSRDSVIVRGPDEGMGASLEHVFWVTASHVTIADITFGWCLYHGIQNHGQEPYNAAGLWVHNCRIVNCNEQFIKGTSASGDPEGVTDGIIENCLFEFTNRWAYQSYTGGIDIHKGANWTVRDNLFRFIRATDGLAEHAIHFWNRNTLRPQNVVVERNIIINCDRGIGFGLGSFASGHEGGQSAIRNNFVYNDGVGPNTDVGIGLESASSVRVDNNTVYVPYGAPIEYRFSGSSNLVFRNNLVNGNITARDGAPAPALSNNLATAQAAWFCSLTNGDLHLILPGATNAMNRGVAVVGFSDDVDRHPRPAQSAWDIGAHEYNPAKEDYDRDYMNDQDEWLAGTNLRDPASFLGVTAVSLASAGIVHQWSSVPGKQYAMALTTNLPAGAWTPAATHLMATPPFNIYTTAAPLDAVSTSYRIELE